MNTLLIPDAQLGDWYGWITNQGAHGMMIGAPLWCALAYAFGPFEGLVWTMGLYAAWEVFQNAEFGGGWIDGITDWSFVALGAALSCALWMHRAKLAAAVLLLMAALAAAGIFTRTRKGKDDAGHH